MFSDDLKDLGIVTYNSGFIKNNWTDNSIVVTDNIQYEVLFKLANGYVFAYDMQTDSFISANTYTPEWFIKLEDGNYLSSDNKKDFWLHNTAEVNRANYYDQDNVSYVKVLDNKYFNEIKVYDTLSWHSTAKDANNVLQNDVTFTNLRVTNDYQNTDWQPLVFNTNVKRKEREFTTFVPRDRVSVYEMNNPDTYDTDNIDSTQLYKRRIRDRYMYVELEKDNSDGTFFTVPYIITNYRKSAR
jgi:hypothetical protein